MKSGPIKYLLFLIAGLFIGGLTVYFIINSRAKKNDIYISQNDSIEQTTVVRDKHVKATVNRVDKLSSGIGQYDSDFDSTDIFSEESLDSIKYTLGEEEFEIVSERMLLSKSMDILLTGPDSLGVEDLLSLKADSYGNSIVVEFWESPLDLIGYELSRTRLKLFGFNANERIRISREYQSEKLHVQMGENVGSMTLVLDKTNRFKSILLK